MSSANPVNDYLLALSKALESEAETKITKALQLFTKCSEEQRRDFLDQQGFYEDLMENQSGVFELRKHFDTLDLMDTLDPVIHDLEMRVKLSERVEQITSSVKFKIKSPDDVSDLFQSAGRIDVNGWRQDLMIYVNSQLTHHGMAGGETTDVLIIAPKNILKGMQPSVSMKAMVATIVDDIEESGWILHNLASYHERLLGNHQMTVDNIFVTGFTDLRVEAGVTFHLTSKKIFELLPEHDRGIIETRRVKKHRT